MNDDEIVFCDVGLVREERSKTGGEIKNKNETGDANGNSEAGKKSASAMMLKRGFS